MKHNAGRTRDHLARKGVLGAAKRSTALEATRFLERARAAFPFAIWAVQTDGGSEYMAEFAQTVEALGITQYVNRPNYPKGQGRVERSFLTDDLEFHQVEDDLPSGVAELQGPAFGLEPRVRRGPPARRPRLPHSERLLCPVAGGWDEFPDEFGVLDVLTPHMRLTTRTNTA